MCWAGGMGGCGHAAGLDIQNARPETRGWTLNTPVHDCNLADQDVIVNISSTPGWITFREINGGRPSLFSRKP